MVKITYKNKSIEIKVEQNTSILDMIRKSGFYIETPCNGNGSCGKCKVKVKEHPSCSYEEKLACTTKATTDIEIELLDKNTQLKTIYSELKNETYKNNVGYKEPNESNFGVAIDIGTTGIAAYLLEVNTGKIINRKSSLNPQTQYGGDVLSRISYSLNNPQGKENLKKVIVESINEIISELVKKTVDINRIHRIVVSANTVMIHMVLGLDTYSMSRAPYKPELLDKLDMKAKDLGIIINPQGVMTTLPSASSYIGADIISGALATGFNSKKHKAVFIDIGTNGEILAISKGKIAGTSTAAGPAFEGMNISWGSRAESGAIDTFKIMNDDIKFTTIDDEQVIGICGSGLIDIVSELLTNNVILKSGRLNNKLDGKLASRIRDKKFYITDDIYLSQKDIRQVQLAKAAIAAGINMLLKDIELCTKDIEEIVIAGAFGYHLNPENMKTIGIIPKDFTGEINFVGNSSIEGAKLALISEKSLKEMIKLKEEIKVVELSIEEDFQDLFVTNGDTPTYW